MRKTYRDENNTTYLARLNITTILMDRFTEDSIHNLRRELRNLLFSFKVTEETDYGIQRRICFHGSSNNNKTKPARS